MTTYYYSFEDTARISAQDIKAVESPEGNYPEGEACMHALLMWDTFGLHLAPHFEGMLSELGDFYMLVGNSASFNITEFKRYTRKGDDIFWPLMEDLFTLYKRNN
jgi:hypothetical protein